MRTDTASTPPAGLEIRTVTSARMSDGAYVLLEIHAPAGLVLPPHAPATGAASVLVLEGELLVVLAGGCRHLGAGDHVLLPPAAPRRVEVVVDARVLCLAVPAGLERLADLLAPPGMSPDDVAAVLSAAGVALLPRRWGDPSVLEPRTSGVNAGVLPRRQDGAVGAGLSS